MPPINRACTPLRNRCRRSNRRLNSRAGADDQNGDNPTGHEFGGALSRQQFERVLSEYDSDRATLLIIDIDHFGQIADEFGNDVAERVLETTAARLVQGTRRHDVVALIGIDAFAVLFGDIDRATGLQVATRLLAAVAAPLNSTAGPEAVTATAALSHQFGLVDTDELFESASTSLHSGKRTSRGRLFVSD